MATRRNCQAPRTGRSTRKPMPWVATGCRETVRNAMKNASRGAMLRASSRDEGRPTQCARRWISVASVSTSMRRLRHRPGFAGNRSPRRARAAALACDYTPSPHGAARRGSAGCRSGGGVWPTDVAAVAEAPRRAPASAGNAARSDLTRQTARPPLGHPEPALQVRDRPAPPLRAHQSPRHLPQHVVVELPSTGSRLRRAFSCSSAFNRTTSSGRPPTRLSRNELRYRCSARAGAGTRSAYVTRARRAGPRCFGTHLFWQSSGTRTAAVRSLAVAMRSRINRTFEKEWA
jgi:hypothetical protein